MTTLIAAADVLGALAGVSPAQASDMAIKATAAAENHCLRPLALANYDQECEPGSTRLIRLKGYPVVSLGRICADLAGVLTVTALGTPWMATVALLTSDGTPQGTPCGVALTSVSGGVTTTTPVLFAPQSGPAILTVQDLAVAINQVSGWSAVATSGLSQCPVSELRPTVGSLGALGSPAQILAYTSTLADYDLDPRTGKIITRLIRPEAYRYPDRTFGGYSPATKVRIVYAAGYNGDPANGPVTTPPDLAEACILIARSMLDNRKVSGAYQTVTLGNTSTTAGSVVAVPGSASGKLSKYVDRRF